jgi:hypothetical protein
VEIVEFQIEHEGARHSCSFEISGGSIKTITVTTPFGVLAAGMGGLPPETLARELAEKLARRAGAAEIPGRRWPVVR